MSGVRFTASPPVRNHSNEGLTQSCKVPSKSPPKAGFCLWTYLRAATVAYRHSGIIHSGPFPPRSLSMQYIGGYPSRDERVVRIRVWPIRDTAISTRRVCGEHLTGLTVKLFVWVASLASFSPSAAVSWCLVFEPSPYPSCFFLPLCTSSSRCLSSCRRESIATWSVLSSPTFMDVHILPIFRVNSGPHSHRAKQAMGPTPQNF